MSLAAVRGMFERCDFYEKVPKESIYLTIHDAVIAALSKKRELLEEVGLTHASQFSAISSETNFTLVIQSMSVRLRPSTYTADICTSKFYIN